VKSKTKALLSWSSGKDSAWTLHVLRQNMDVEIVGLVTTVNEVFDRVAMHAVRMELLEAQANSTGLPLWKVPIPSPCSNEEYEAAMSEVLRKAKSQSITAMAFGDLFLEDIRNYRVQRLADSGVEPLFPIWGIDTALLAREMISAGLRARITCIDPKQLPVGFAGRDFDENFLADLPAGVDPCGERGEFHSFAYEGPMFPSPIKIRSGEIVERGGFVFVDLLPERANGRINE
jgi:uncharacterized protein (TIGR00290 family)